MSSKIDNPAFICVGVNKAGTSWLHQKLNDLPDVDMPRAKELKFYWGYGHPKRTFIGSQPSWSERKIGHISWIWRRNYFKRKIRETLSGEDKFTLGGIAWDLKYLFLPQSVAWYKSLFPKGKISGDIDGQYSYFDQNIVDHIKKEFPKIKILIVLRNPLQRYWSQLRMWAYHIESSGLDNRTDKQIARRLSRMIIEARPYAELIELWKSNFPEDQFHVAYYDDLEADPRKYLESICEFIGAQPPDANHKGLDEVVFKGHDFALPKLAELEAYRLLIPDVSRLVKIVDSPHPKRWLEVMLERQAMLEQEVQY